MLRSSKQGMALVVVLAFIVLVTGLVAAFLSRTGTVRQIAHGSFNNAKADQLARSALDIIVADFKQEIASGVPITNSTIVPQRSPKPAAGSTPAIANLIRRSVRADAIPAPAVSSRASAANSTADVSVNGRSVSLARWNRHYLVPKTNPSDDASDPITPGFSAPDYWAPDWVIVTRSGPTVFSGWNSGLADSTNASYALGRYAYAVYDEGGLLDFNVAGYPYPSPSPAVTPAALIMNRGRKGVSAFADLTAMKITFAGATPNPTAVTKMVAWRNYATLKASGTFPTLSPTPDPAASDFVTYSLKPTRDFLTVDATLYNNRTDQAFLSRQQLIDLFSAVGASFNTLQFLGTFSREHNLPTWSDSATRLVGRFPLSRFDLFTNPTGNVTDIRRYFGVVYVAASRDTPEHWQYFGAQGTGLQASIQGLTGNQQDPDLSVLLRYAYPVTTTDGEILSIIASLIDQQDSDSNTTWIEYGDPTAPTKAFGADSIPPANPSDPRPSSSPIVLKRPFRNVGELGYAYRNASTTLDFHSAGSPDAPLLDLFSYNTAATRAGIVNLNSQNSAVLAALIQGAISNETTTAFVGEADPASNKSKTAYAAATAIIAHPVDGTSVNPAIGRQDVSRLVAAAGTAIGSIEEAEETVARAVAEVSQTRTWGLMIDVIAQSGRYPPSATNLAQFVVEGEKRYWLHVAIDRFTSEIIDQQLEAVYE
jgi:type II secretory pathway component PulK